MIFWNKVGFYLIKEFVVVKDTKNWLDGMRKAQENCRKIRLLKKNFDVTGCEVTVWCHR